MNRAKFKVIRRFTYIVFGLALILNFLVGCEKTPQKIASDGYIFEQPQFKRYEFPIDIVIVDSQSKLEEIFETKTGKKFQGKDRTLAAFSSLTYDPTTLDYKCTVFVINPEVSYSPEFIGHELTHCFYGQWHPTQP